jgi:dipeptidyl aminopeptidase/acylaminoacyl peptidase
VLFAVPAGAAARMIQISDLRHIVDVSDPHISPDGRQIVCLVTRPNYEKNSDDSDVLLVDIASGAQRTLTFGRPDVSSPQWSPNGDRLA